MIKYPHLTEKELSGLDKRLCVMLLKAQDLDDSIAYVITSGRRTPAQNAKAGGVKGSAHEQGLAVDLRAQTTVQKQKIVAALKAAGFVRIGIYSGHIHCDIDASKPQVAWAGGISHA